MAGAAKKPENPGRTVKKSFLFSAIRDKLEEEPKRRPSYGILPVRRPPLLWEVGAVKRAIRSILIVLCLGVFCYAGWQLLSTLLEYKKAGDFYAETAGEYVAESAAEDAQADASIRKVQPEDRPAEYVREDGQETAPISVDFDALLAANSDVVGWIYCEDTVINYPLVQTANNEDYLHRMLNGEYSTSGTLFLDYQCGRDFSSDNSIIYGHNMKNGAMFHSLLGYRDPSCYGEHPVLYLLTPTGNYALKLFAGFVTPSDSWAYVIQFGDAAEKEAYLQKAVDASDFRALVTPTAEDRIVTLSTCCYDYADARYVVLGILVPVA